MDELKLKIDIREALKAVSNLEEAINNYDHRQIGAQLYILQQRLHMAASLLGIDPADFEQTKKPPV